MKAVGWLSFLLMLWGLLIWVTEVRPRDAIIVELKEQVARLEEQLKDKEQIVRLETKLEEKEEACPTSE